MAAILITPTALEVSTRRRPHHVGEQDVPGHLD